MSHEPVHDRHLPAHFRDRAYVGTRFALQLKWTPVSGWFGWEYRILPALTLGLFYAAYIARMTRGGMLEMLSLDYIRTARAKGLSDAAVILKHALRGGIMPVVSFLGPAIAGVISGHSW